MFPTLIAQAISGFELCYKGGFPFLLGLPFLSIDFSALPSIFFGLAISLSILTDFRCDAIYRVVKDRFLQLALPDNDDIPPLGFQLSPNILVSFLIPCHFSHPKLRIGLGDSEILAPLVSVPETTVDEDDSAVLWEDDVGRTRQVSIIHLISESLAPECVTEFQFRLG